MTPKQRFSKQRFSKQLESKQLFFKQLLSKQLGFKQLGFKQLGFKQLGFKQLGFKQLGFKHFGFKHLGKPGAFFLLATAFGVAGCGGKSTTTAAAPSQPSLITPAVTLTTASASITTAQSLAVTIAVTSAGTTPAGTVVLTGGNYVSASLTLASGEAAITLPAGSLATGKDTLTATYTPSSASSSTYTAASTSVQVTVTPPPVAPAVAVTPATTSSTTAQSIAVSIAVTGSNGTPTGTIILSGSTYTSAAATLSSGAATVTIPSGTFAVGSYTLTASYTPDTPGAIAYTTASGTAALTVTLAPTAVTVSINTLANRHQISPYVYGGNIGGAQNVADLNLPFGRWGGNATSTYNWQLHTYNADNDYYWEDFGIGNTNGNDNDSVKFITDVQNAGGNAITTMAMLNWVAQSAENGSNGHWSFPVATYGPQCSVDPYNKDAGNGLKPDCSTPVTTAAITTAYYPLLDDTTQTCPNPGNCVYRSDWAKALAAAFSSSPCLVPYSTITTCHFYDMDNETDIWGGTHRDIHPTPSGYDELASVYETEAARLKVWDPAAVRFGPVSCCWYFYWNGNNGSDKGNHGGVDLLPWWLNQVYWTDQINGARTLDVFDIHAYPDADTGGLTTAQLQALSASVYRDYWDPTYVSTSGTIDQVYVTSIQPNRTVPFRIPRMKALVNAIYPGTPLSFTEWSAAFYQEADFSTALGDADAYGLFGREALSFASRWVLPALGNPNYLALKLFTNYDGNHHAFGTASIADTNTGNVNSFSSFAALNAARTVMTIMVINKDPANSAQVTFNTAGFNPSTYVAYSITSTAATAIATSASTAWSPTQTFPPYSITMLAVSGAEATPPASQWYVNPDDLMVPAAGTATLHPTLSSGTTGITLSSAVFDAFEGAAACPGSLTLTNAAITPSQPAAIAVTAGSSEAFCHYTVTGTDGSTVQTQGGWIVVGKPPAALTQSGSNQAATAGTALTNPLTVTLTPGQSGGAANGAAFLFTTSAGTLSNGTATGKSVIATANSTGTASVTLTLPTTAGTVNVTAQAQFALGGASVTFTATAK